LQGSIGFSLSRDNGLAEEVRASPAICQLDQAVHNTHDAVYLTFDFGKRVLRVNKSGAMTKLGLCSTSIEYFIENC
jgi:hypothetical protein